MTPVEATNFIAGLANERITALGETPTTQKVVAQTAEHALSILQSHFADQPKDGSDGEDHDH